MCDCLNDVVEIAVCVQAGAISDAEAPQQLDVVAAWADHQRTIDLPMAIAAPVHYAIALINVPRGGAAAGWLVAELDRLVSVAEESGLHPAWRAYGGLWLAHLATVAGLHASDPTPSTDAFDSARRHVLAAGGICPDALYAPPSLAELEQFPYAWLDCDEPRITIPDRLALAAGISGLPGPADEVALTPLVMGLRTMSSDDWRSWRTPAILRQLYAVDPVS